MIDRRSALRYLAGAPLVAGASLTLGAFEAHSDREPEAAARITLTAPLGLMSDTNTEITQLGHSTGVLSV